MHELIGRHKFHLLRDAGWRCADLGFGRRRHIHQFTIDRFQGLDVRLARTGGDHFECGNHFGTIAHTADWTQRWNIGYIGAGRWQYAIDGQLKGFAGGVQQSFGIFRFANRLNGTVDARSAH